MFPERIAMLDGWRGLAALAVLFHHLGIGGFGIAAVMLFFVISGYCITAAVDSCLRNGVGLRTFMWRRARRIYPPYLFSLVFFLATRIVKAASGDPSELNRTALEYLQNATLTQWVTLVFQPSSAAWANPTLFVTAYWSLGYEEQFYGVMGVALAAAAFGRRLLPIVAVLIGIGIAWNVLWPSLSRGFFLDYWVHFAIGCLVFFRLCRLRTASGRRGIDLFLVLLAISSTWMPSRFSPGWGDERFVYDEWLITSVFGLVLIATRPLDELYRASLLGKILSGLGLISFSLYLVHQVNMVAIRSVVSFVVADWMPESANMTAEIGAHIGLASVFWLICERPFLNRSLEAARRPRTSYTLAEAAPRP